MKTLSTIFLLLFMTTLIIAQEVSIVTNSVANAGSMYYFHGRHVARTPNGLLMVVWTDKSGQGGQIISSIYDKDFKIWSPGAPVSSAAYQASNPAVAADDLGNIHATWQEKATSAGVFSIMYANYNGIKWSTPKKISLDPKTCEEPTIEVDSKNYIWVVYNNDGANAPNEFVSVVSSKDGGATWSSTATSISAGGNIGTSITNGRTVLAAGPNGRLVAIWHDGQPWNAGRREIFANQYDGTAWQGQVMISDTTSKDRKENWYPTVAIDKNSNIYALYHTNADGTDPRHMILQKKSWDQSWSASTQKIIFDETVADMLATSAVCDDDGVIHFVYNRDLPVDTTGIDALYYMFSKNGGNTWSNQIKVSRNNYDGGYVTLGNRVRKQYGIDIAFRESVNPFINDEATTTVLYTNVPYSIVTTDVKDENNLPLNFELLTNYPNPFNPSTTIEYKIAERGLAVLSIYDILGRLVKILINENLSPGAYKVKWDGDDYNKNPVTSGVYIATLKTERGLKSIKMQLLK